MSMRQDDFRRPSLPSESVAQRAYQLYESRGREPGHELDDWLAAERELQTQGPLELADDWQASQHRRDRRR